MVASMTETEAEKRQRRGSGRRRCVRPKKSTEQKVVWVGCGLFCG